MKGYPQTINTKQDFVNILATDAFRERALADLRVVIKTKDEKATQATTLIDPENPKAGYNIVEIENPMPLWKVKGFESREEAQALYEGYGGDE